MAKATKKQDKVEDRYQDFKKQLKAGDFPRMYVFYGEETYLIGWCRNSLKKKLVAGPAEEFNYHRFTEENFSIEALQEAVDAIPVMSERSLVEVTDIDFFAFPEYERDQMAALISDIPDYCTLLFLYETVAWNPSGRMRKLTKAMEPVCRQIAMNRQPENSLMKFITDTLTPLGKSIPDHVSRYLIQQTGGDMATLASELGKLAVYTDQPQICKKDIDDVVIPVLEAQVFDITRAIVRRNFDTALEKLQNLLHQDAEPIAICAAIGKQFREMYAARVLSEHGKGYGDLMDLYGLRDFVAKQIFSQVGGYKKQQLQATARLCAETDYAMKTSGGDKEVLLTTLILRIRQLGGTQ